MTWAKLEELVAMAAARLWTTAAWLRETTTVYSTLQPAVALPDTRTVTSLSTIPNSCAKDLVTAIATCVAVKAAEGKVVVVPVAGAGASAESDVVGMSVVVGVGSDVVVAVELVVVVTITRIRVPVKLVVT
jgi:hypothetical protein